MALQPSVALAEPWNGTEAVPYSTSQPCMSDDSTPTAPQGLPPWRPRRKTRGPLLLFWLTCVSTFFVGATSWKPILFLDGPEAAVRAVGEDWRQGLTYMVALMAILSAHEMGHFLVSVRNRIPASFPYFLPMPLSPLGTFGAFIVMQSSRANRRQIFDIGISGPLAGLVVAIPILWIGVHRSDPSLSSPLDVPFGTPLVAHLLALVGSAPRPELAIHFHMPNPYLAAGWVGMFVTGVNMVPVSQFDGGHIIHGLLGKKSIYISRAFLIFAILWVLVFEQYCWVLMVVLVTLIGTDHPPTADDSTHLDWKRYLLGWASMAIPVLCLPLA